MLVEHVDRLSAVMVLYLRSIIFCMRRLTYDIQDPSLVYYHLQQRRINIGPTSDLVVNVAMSFLALFSSSNRCLEVSDIHLTKWKGREDGIRGQESQDDRCLHKR